MEHLNFDTQGHACDYMHQLRPGLAYGVGNNMQIPFYTYSNSHEINFWPDGIKGHLISIKFIKSEW